MRDQVRALEQLGVRAAFLNSSLPLVTQDAVMTQALSGDLDLLYIAPERLLQDATLAALRRCAVCLIAIDEALAVFARG